MQEEEGGGEVVSFRGQLADELFLTIEFFLVYTMTLHTIVREKAFRLMNRWW